MNKKEMMTKLESLKLDWEKINVVLSAQLGYQTNVEVKEFSVKGYDGKYFMELDCKDDTNLISLGRKFFGPTMICFKEVYLDLAHFSNKDDITRLVFNFNIKHSSGGSNSWPAVNLKIESGLITIEEQW